MENCLYISKVNISRDSEFFIYDINYPIIKLKKEYICQEKFDLYVINEINNKIYKDVLDFKNNTKLEAKEYKKLYNTKISKECKECVKYKYEVYINYKATYDRNRIISIPMTKYKFNGGAHGMTYLESYNYDLLIGEMLKFKELFREGVNYKKLINDFIREEIMKEPEKYFKDDYGFKGISEDQSFYIDEDGIVIYFPLYEISPYYVGIPKFKLKFKDYKKYLKYK